MTAEEASLPVIGTWRLDYLGRVAERVLAQGSSNRTVNDRHPATRGLDQLALRRRMALRVGLREVAMHGEHAGAC